ncbi:MULTISPECIES: pyridoxal-dependent decarboxylase [unclassified Lentimicrobium]|uniref:pyridoxal phosphate-dependent decarboxylase family protein n=1 Tax=unclassified Lentimicrobium TaxID=2677434 RepID=UPI00155217D3|nr:MULTISPECIES: pyridoxal-dependent decarboxylase [unclassified Lentimicrobium]NPD45049.1 aminotransferase class V-fold PLP-dependent enzyme [Lentimicrobium sp. S6]NPD84553.1 aminotransferase class V-fold PLP-dependent enzyme [Lentimicrobium sp. L6]
MKSKKLSTVYDAQKFKEFGHELVDLLSEHLEEANKEETLVQHWKSPAERLEFWQQYEMDKNSPKAFFQDILEGSVNIHHANYMGHQVSPPAPLGALASFTSSLLNNGMAIYEMGAAGTAIEKVVIDDLNQRIGYDDNSDGYITHGGTLANLTALLSARKAMVEKDVWEEGSSEKLGIMVSSEAHYCVDRAVRIMGMGAAGMIKIPVDKNYAMKTELLEEHYQKAKSDGIRVMAVVGSAPSTSTGMYDDLEAIADFCEAKKLWFHVDGAHGGAAIFSKKYKHYLKGIHRADSVVIDGHKMLMTPTIMTFLLFKNKNHSYATFSQKAVYLLSKKEEEQWYNIAIKSFECTKRMMSIQFYILFKFYGEEIFDEYVTTLYDLGKELAGIISTRLNFELAIEPDTNIVCFRYHPQGKSKEELNSINAQLRQQLLEQGKFYIVQTSLKGEVFMRTTIMNPKTTTKNFELLLDEIEALAG